MTSSRPISLTSILALALFIGLTMPPTAEALNRTQLAVVINVQDGLSVKIGNYYAKRRHLQFQNLIRVSFPTGSTSLSRQQFDAIRQQVERQTLPNIQAYALTWASPYRVECMSITTAFAFGFDTAFCAEGCRGTRPSPYFDSPARLPFSELKMRPTMSIAALSFEQAKKLIDRGVASDGTMPAGTAYLVSTSDPARNVRSQWYELAEELFRTYFRVRLVHADALVDKNDVMFYFIGKVSVDALDTVRFLPGAIADHLTSAGGLLTDSGQMSALRWLEAGATGSYGTVVEPCNMQQKFPQPTIAIGHYLHGETLIEAYWKSVKMPGQGIFVGEPLASPFRR